MRQGEIGGPVVELSPITRTTAAQAVADQLLAMIRSGALQPGDRFPPERELMERLGVGRSSVREALQILSAVNVISSVPGAGTFVKEPQADEVLRADLIGFLIGDAMARHLLEAREMIEPDAARLAAVRGTEEDHVALETLLQAHERALKAGEPINEFAARFHVALAAAAHNQVLQKFMESILELLMKRGRKIERIPDYAKQELREHREIFDLVRRRDADGAAEYLRNHIRRSAVTYDADQ